MCIEIERDPRSCRDRRGRVNSSGPGWLKPKRSRDPRTRHDGARRASAAQRAPSRPWGDTSRRPRTRDRAPRRVEHEQLHETTDHHRSRRPLGSRRAACRLQLVLMGQHRAATPVIGPGREGSSGRFTRRRTSRGHNPDRAHPVGPRHGDRHVRPCSERWCGRRRHRGRRLRVGFGTGKTTVPATIVAGPVASGSRSSTRYATSLPWTSVDRNAAERHQSDAPAS
jgi:hypothetical protein